MNKTIAYALAACLALAAAACSQSGDANVASASAEVSGVPYDKLVGQWQFVYDDARRGVVESKLATEIRDPAELARAKGEAAEEAAVSHIEFTKDRFYVSYIGDREILRGHVEDAPPGLTLTLRDDRTLVMHDPRKGDLIFSRR
jgi:hypothetical protein